MRDNENIKSEVKSLGAKQSRGRPRKFDEADVLMRLVNLFWDKGYEATSLSEIVETTGLKKGSLYSLFGGKRDMYLKSLAHYNVQYVKTACEALRDTSAGLPGTRLDRFLSSPIEAVTDNDDYRGCFLCNASAETTQRDTDIHSSISAAQDDIVRALEFVLEEDKPTQDSELITQRAKSLLVTYTGMRILVRANCDVELLQAAKKAALDFSRRSVMRRD